jgi:luciferase family oxidoreductase group 1
VFPALVWSPVIPDRTGNVGEVTPIPLSVLDLAPITRGSTAGDALRNSLDLARHAERLGYKRHWVAEHHNMQAIASAATAVVAGYLAAGTSTIRIGAGGIMLPNHSPLVIAEQFGTLESLYPGRIDLGLGRAPGTDQLTARALRRDPLSADRFPRDVQDLQVLFGPARDDEPIRAIPGSGLEVPLWILGSSTFGARLAALLGLPYAFASHFAPTDLMAALELYRRDFRPSAQLAEPYAMAGLNVYAADTDEEARRLFTTPQQSWANRFRGLSGPYPPPIDDIETYWSAAEKAQASAMLSCSVVGSLETVRKGVEQFRARTGVDELMVVTAIYDHAARVRSYEILAEAV